MREEWESNSRYTGRQAGRRAGQRHGKRRKRRRIIKGIIGIALVISLIMAVRWAGDMIGGQHSLEVMALVNPKVHEVLENREAYPEQLIELLQNNEETVDFVLDYPSGMSAGAMHIMQMI